jgi:hypothetical protein
LAKSVLKVESRVWVLHPLASALYVHNADPKSFGVTASGILYSGMRFSDGCAVLADSVFPIRAMLRGLGARLKGLRELRRSH